MIRAQSAVRAVAISALAIGCHGRVRTDGSGDATGPNDGGATSDGAADAARSAVLFECTSEDDAARLRFEHLVSQEPPDWRRRGVQRWAEHDGQLAFVQDDDLVAMSHDGTEIGRVEGEERSVWALSPLATTAVVLRDDAPVLVAIDGDFIAELGSAPILGTYDVDYPLTADFSGTGRSIILEMGVSTLRGEIVNAVQIRGLDGAVLHQLDGWDGALRNDDASTIVGIAGDQVVAVDTDENELWRATNHAPLNLMRGSRSLRSVYVHSDSIGFYEGANNDGLLVIDGVARSEYYMLPAGFSPNGRWIASSIFEDVVMRDEGAEIWSTIPMPEFLADSVSVNDDGIVLTSGIAQVTTEDGGATYRAAAFLHDRDGSLLLQCEKSGLATRTYSSFSYDGSAFALHGVFGAAVYDVQ